MKIVVTGALGHIGSRLIRELPEMFSEAEIVLIDNFSTQRYCSLFNLPASGQYYFHEADVLTADLSSIFDGASVVVHLAAITDATNSFEIKETVFPSTTSVYGSQADKVDEDCPISDLKPQSPYAEAKLRVERLLQNLGEEKGLSFVICRLGTIFGTSIGMRFHTAINKFCWQAVMGKPLTVWRTAMHQHRPYLDLGDAVEAIKFIIQKKLYDGRVYNIVTTNTSISSIVDIISANLPDISIEYVDTEIMNQLSYDVSNYRFSKLGFEFKGDLEQGIVSTIGLLKRARQGLRIK